MRFIYSLKKKNHSKKHTHGKGEASYLSLDSGRYSLSSAPFRLPRTGDIRDLRGGAGQPAGRKGDEEQDEDEGTMLPAVAFACPLASALFCQAFECVRFLEPLASLIVFVYFGNVHSELKRSSACRNAGDGVYV